MVIAQVTNADFEPKRFRGTINIRMTSNFAIIDCKLSRQV